MSHDPHGHAASEEAEAPEPIQIPLAPPRNYLWPLGLSLVVAALLIYFLLIMDNGLNSPPTVGQNTGMSIVTLTATAEPSAVALSSPTSVPLSTATPLLVAPTLSVSSTSTATAAPLASASPSPSATIASASPAPGPSNTPLVSPPVSLVLGNSSFTVESALQASPEWKFNNDPSTASWLPTTAEPYIIGIPYDAANAALFAAAKPGDIIMLRNALGATLRFQAQSVTRVAPESITTLQDSRTLGLNLYLLNDPAATRALINATFLDATGGQ